MDEKKPINLHPLPKPRVEHIYEKKEDDSKPKTTWDQDIRAIKRTLEAMGRELDTFHANPQAYDRKKLEELVKSFLYELKTVLADSDHFSRIQDSLQPEGNRLRGAWKRLKQMVHSEEVDEYGLDRQFEMAIKPFFDFLYYRYFRVEVHGIDNLPYEGRSLLVSNHSGVIPFDGAMIKVAVFNEHPTQREVRFLVDDFVFHFPFLGTLMNRIGGVRACPENAERILRQGELMSVFPEGIKGIAKPFQERYRLERFGRGGVTRLAMRTRSPVVPVAVIGAEETYPLIYKSQVLARPLGLPFIPFTPLFPWLGPLGAIPLPTKWSIYFGEPLAMEDYTAKDLNDNILINRLTEEIRQKVQQLVDHGLKQRESIFGKRSE